MSSDLQATLEFCLELHKFYNVDLFLRGFYKIQASLRATNTKLPVRIEMSNSNLLHHNHAHHKQQQQQKSKDDSSCANSAAATSSSVVPPPPLPPTTGPGSVTPPTTNNNSTPPLQHQQSNSDNNTGSPATTTTTNISSDGGTSSSTSSSRPFRILFRSEELDLRDIFVFRVHFNLDSISHLNVQRLIEDLSRVEYILEIKLCFNDAVVSSRKLTINLTNYTINYYRPVFFDYFHLCAVSLSVHGGLIAFHVTKNTLLSSAPSKPDVINNVPTSSNSNSSPTTVASSSSSSSTSCVPSCSVSSKLSHARATHESIMQILTESNAGLKTKLIEFLQVLGKHELVESIRQHATFFDLNKDTCSSSNSSHHHKRSLSLCEEMEEYLLRAHKQIAHLCAENILLWHRFLDLIIGKDPIRVYLANLHHQLRVKRFSEGFYITENPLRSAYTSKDYSPIVELLKKSINYSPLPLECTEIDGDSTSIPIVFEDLFSDHSAAAQEALAAAAAAPPVAAVPVAASSSCTCGVVLTTTTTTTTSIKPSKSLSDVSSRNSRLVPLAAAEEEESSLIVAASCCSSSAAAAASTLPRRHSSWVTSTEGHQSSTTTSSRRRTSRHSTNSHHQQRIHQQQQHHQLNLRKFNSTPLLSEIAANRVVSSSSTTTTEEEDCSVSSSSSSDESGWVSEDSNEQDGDEDEGEDEVQVGAASELLDQGEEEGEEFQGQKQLSSSSGSHQQHHHPRRKRVSSSSKKKPPVAPPQNGPLFVIPPPPQFQDIKPPDQFRDNNDDTNVASTKPPCSCLSPTAPAAAALVSTDLLKSSSSSPSKSSAAAPSTVSATFLTPSIPYFLIPDELRVFHPKGLHLIICVHGLDGSCHDLRLFKIYLEVSLSGQNVHFLMSEKNQDGSTFNDFSSMTGQFVSEILNYISTNKLNPARISFVGHSLGNIIIRSALTNPALAHLIPKLHTFLSLSGPHLGTLYNTGIVNMGMWLMQKWKKSLSLLQLSMKDHSDIRQTFLYKLSEKSNLDKFKFVLLCGSSQDRYVPVHSAHIINCKHSLKDFSNQGTAYREMVMNILTPLLSNSRTKLIRYDVHHAIQPHTANSIIGRAAHIAVLDSEIFIEKFLSVSGVKYFQ